MNDVLELKGKRFIQAPKSGGGGGPAMNSQVNVTSKKVVALLSKLRQIDEFWKMEKKPFKGILISVHYNKIVAKTNRISGIFKGDKSNYAIVGAKFNSEKTKHIITYFLATEDLDNTISTLHKVEEVLTAFFEDGITKAVFESNYKFDRINFPRYQLSKSLFRQVIADISYIEDFEIESMFTENISHQPWIIETSFLFMEPSTMVEFRNFMTRKTTSDMECGQPLQKEKTI